MPRGPRAALLASAALALAGCAPEPATLSLLRQDLDRVRTDLTRVLDRVSEGQAQLRGDVQDGDRRTLEAVTDVQRGAARLASRLDELDRRLSRLQGQIEELRLRADALALQLEVEGLGPGRPGSASRPSPSGTAAAGAPPSGSVPGGAPPVRPPLSPVAQANELYQTAYIDYTRGSYRLAIAGFREFIRLYPTTDLAQTARYWIGESHLGLARGFQLLGERDRVVQELEEAVQDFRQVATDQPAGDRTPAAIHKEALALVELGQMALAEARLQFLLDQFPSREEASRAREDLERIRKRQP